MIALCIDFGSSGVRAALYNTETLAPVAGPAAVPWENLLHIRLADVHTALNNVLAQLGPLTSVDIVSHSSLSPSLCLLGPVGHDVPLLTHAHRQSVNQARRIEATIGRERFLSIAGNRPVPGGFSVTSLLWLMQHNSAAVEKAEGIGHVSTWFTWLLTGQVVMDYSHACFTGLMDHRTLQWSKELCNELKITAQLPAIQDAGAIAGKVTPEASALLGIPAGVPVLGGIIDTSAAILCTDLATGTLVHSIGTTDVLAMLCDRPHPSDRWLTRHLGTGDHWLSVCTIAAGCSTFLWLHKLCFSEMPLEAFHEYLRKAFTSIGPDAPPAAHFEPFLSGSRLDVEQRTASYTGLTLATQRDDLLAAALIAYRQLSNTSLAILTDIRQPRPAVLVTGGGSPIADLLHADWPSWMKFNTVKDANLRGLAVLANRATAKQP